MSGPVELPREVRRFAQRLMAAQVPAGRLSPIEERLLSIMPKLYLESIIVARIGRTPPDAEPVPITPELVAEGARFAVIAAVEIEQHLRTVRGHIEDQGGQG